MIRVPEFRHRDRISAFCAEETERLGHAVLLLPLTEYSERLPDGPPDNFNRKDRVGRLLERRVLAYSPEQAFNTATLFSISFTNGIRGVGSHFSQHANGYDEDLMAKNPDRIHGEGYVAIIDGYGWVGDEYDPVLSDGARFTNTIGEATLLGLGVVDLSDLSADVRRVSEPSMEHYQRPVPIGM